MPDDLGRFQEAIEGRPKFAGNRWRHDATRRKRIRPASRPLDARNSWRSSRLPKDDILIIGGYLLEIVEAVPAIDRTSAATYWVRIFGDLAGAFHPGHPLEGVVGELALGTYNSFTESEASDILAMFGVEPLEDPDIPCY